MREVPRRRLAVVAALFFALTGCQSSDPLYRVADQELNAELQRLLRLNQGLSDAGPEQRFVVLTEVARVLRTGGEHALQRLFLTTYVETHPQDPYNAYYLVSVAQGYQEAAARPLAVHYYDRVLKNYQDVLVQGESLHLACLNALLGLVEDPHLRVEYYKELIGRFSDRIDLGTTYYRLARAYEVLGEWEQSIQTYRQFLSYPDAEVAGDPNAFREIEEKVRFYYSDKSWTIPDLELLVGSIKNAIVRRDVRTLNRLKAKVNFFTRAWEGQSRDADVQNFQLESFPLALVRFDPDLDPDSNTREALLRTTGWSWRINTWYLYFRRIDFKMDPEVDGRWEWAGIYFGEKL